jgi:small-conductance mechanosensitive channel
MIDIYRSLVTGVTELLATLASNAPRLMLAIGVFVIGLLIADFARRSVYNAIVRHKHGNRISIGLAHVAFVAVTVVAGLASLAILGVDVGSLIAGLGLTSLAVGFALRDILENFAAGILLSFSQPYGAGDWIRVGTEEGTVVDMTVRATKIRTADGTEVYLPNRMVYTGVVENKTARPERRFSIELPVPPGIDARAACAASAHAATQAPGVLVTPSTDAQAFVDSAGALHVRVYYWASSQADTVRLSTQVLAAVQAALQAALREQLPTSA